MNKAFGIALSMLLLVASLPAKTTHSSGKKKATTTSHSKSKTSSSHGHVSKTSSKHHKKTPKTKKIRGQQGIQSERAREIQAALIREHYLDGEPSGDFDARTKEALQRFQRDNGWQTKVIPDSRALIKLGLGPSKDGLLNPESAAIAQPHELGEEREIPGGSIPTPQRK